MRLVTDRFEPPRTANLRSLTVQVLSPRYAEQDFAAVSSSADTMRHVFGPDNDWPAEGITFEANWADLARHEREFNEKSAFAYALFDPNGERYFGCLYLRSIKSKTGRDQRHKRFSAQAFLWMSSLHQDVTDESAHAEVAEWFTTTWGLDRVAWPGRSPSWEEWKALAAQSLGAT